MVSQFTAFGSYIFFSSFRHPWRLHWQHTKHLLKKLRIRVTIDSESWGVCVARLGSAAAAAALAAALAVAALAALLDCRVDSCMDIISSSICSSVRSLLNASV